MNALANKREIILFDNAGVGKSSGKVPPTFSGWAEDMETFVRALGLSKIDLLGFSMGGLAVTLLALNAPGLVRKLIIAGSTASVPSASFVSGAVWPREQADPKYVTQLASAVSLQEGRDALRDTFFPPNTAGERAFEQYWHRLGQRAEEPAQLGLLPMDPNGSAQIAAVVDAAKPSPEASFDRLGELTIPVLVANGDDDKLIPTSRSWELLTQLANAQLIIYPRGGHGFLWQYAERFAEDVNRFLDAKDFEDVQG